MFKSLIAAAAFVLLASTAQAAPIAPISTNSMVQPVRLGCGPGRTRVNGVCVARTTIRHERRMTRRAYRRGAM